MLCFAIPEEIHMKPCGSLTMKSEEATTQVAARLLRGVVLLDECDTSALG